MQQLNTMCAHYHDLKVLIIDGISMVGCGMLNFINLRLKEIKGSTKSFGDVSVLAVGDLYQLKPIHDAWVFSQVYRTPQLQCIATNLWIDLFDFFELKEVMRQKDDHSFALLLNRLREGKHTEEDLDILKKRHIEHSSTSRENIQHLPQLFCTRNEAYCHNTTVLSYIQLSDIITIDSIDTVSGNVSSSLHEKIISKIPLDPSKTLGLYKNLVLGVGLPGELGLLLC